MSIAPSSDRRHATPADARFANLAGASPYLGLLGAAVLLWWLEQDHAAALPVWAPWEFSFVEFLGCWLAVFWYLRGLARTPAAARPSLGRRVAFFAGMLTIYAVLETRFEYLAEHQFFLNRVQHVAMHHAGPFLLALAWPGETLRRGMPGWTGRLTRNAALRAVISVLQQPAVATVLFVGTFFFWLIPAVHFRAMLDLRLFRLMNWSMVVDGILFWFLVLDPRPCPPARTSFVTRAALGAGVMLPMIMIGALIFLSRQDLYPIYDLCGRLYPGIGAADDQVLGGLIIWVPTSMMSVLAFFLVVRFWIRAEGTEAALSIAPK